MKEIIPKDEYGVFADSKDTARVNSLYVAEQFGKRHDNVINDIRKITAPNSGLSENFIVLNFKDIKYKDSRGRTQKAYAMTRDGFTMLVMGYTGAKAMKFKELYIKRFNEMENFIRELVVARKDYPLLTANIAMLYESPKPYHFANEADMLNRLITGKSAKQFRLDNGIEKGKSIRPYLTADQIEMLEVLQKVDVGLLVAFPNYEDRKRRLEWYKMKMFDSKKLKEEN